MSVTLATLFLFSSPLAGPQTGQRSEPESLALRPARVPVRLAFLGDYGTQSSASFAVAALVRELDPWLVLTLGDVLFDTAQATLKAGADRTLDRLASFMMEYPERQVAIEGHTDSRGSDDYNRDLSKRRADSVRDALVDRGVQAQRIRSVGLGEAYPVAGNDTAGGMQQNRRVEIVISDESGNFPEGQRAAAASN